MNQRPFTINPMKVCTDLHGAHNLLDVRDCVMGSLMRFYGPFNPLTEVGLQEMIDDYLIQMIKNAGKNPNAIKLAMPMTRLQARFFIERYEQTLDKKKAYELCMQDADGNKDQERDCMVDYHALQYMNPQ